MTMVLSLERTSRQSALHVYIPYFVSETGMERHISVLRVD